MLQIIVTVNDNGEVKIDRNVSGAVTIESFGKMTQAMAIAALEANNMCFVQALQSGMITPEFNEKFYSGAVDIIQKKIEESNKDIPAMREKIENILKTQKEEQAKKTTNISSIKKVQEDKSDGQGSLPEAK